MSTHAPLIYPAFTPRAKASATLHFAASPRSRGACVLRRIGIEAGQGVPRHCASPKWNTFCRLRHAPSPDPPSPASGRVCVCVCVCMLHVPCVLCAVLCAMLCVVRRVRPCPCMCHMWPRASVRVTGSGDGLPDCPGGGGGGGRSRGHRDHDRACTVDEGCWRVWACVCGGGGDQGKVYFCPDDGPAKRQRRSAIHPFDARGAIDRRSVRRAGLRHRRRGPLRHGPRGCHARQRANDPWG
jgi:hypothetical protein